MAPTREGVLVALLLGLTAPAGAELYRWTDAQGNEHFSANPHDVPPEHRSQAREAGSAVGGHVNGYQAPASAAPSPRALHPSPRGPALAGQPPSDSEAIPTAGGRSPSSWRSEAVDHVSRIERAEQALERCEDLRVPDAQDSSGRRHVSRYQGLGDLDRCDRERRRVEDAEQGQTRFEDAARAAGVPPGWMR